MNQHRTPSTRRLPVGPALLALALVTTPALVRAQEEGRRREAPTLSASEVQRILAFKSGSAEVTDGDQDLLNKAAKFYVDRVTWREYQKAAVGEEGSQTSMVELMRQAFSVLPDGKKVQLQASQINYMRHFAPPLITEIKAVLHNPKWIARINAARILAQCGRTGVSAFGDAMAQVVKDPKQIDAVRLYALRGLRDLYEVMERTEEIQFSRKNLPDRNRWAAAIIGYVTSTPKLPPLASQAEIDGIRYVRREAVRALGNSRIAGDSTPPNNPTALVLVRLMRGDGFTPPPALSEKFEAAVAIAKLHIKDSENYQPGYALHEVGDFLAEYLTAYENERTPDAVKTRGWVYEATVLSQALAALKEEIGNKNKYATDVIDHLISALRPVEGKRASNPPGLRDWLKEHPVPKDQASVYKGDDKSVVGAAGG